VMEFAVVAAGSLLTALLGFHDSLLGAGGEVVVSSVSVAPFTSIVDVEQLRARLRGVELEERVYAVVRVGGATALLVGLPSGALEGVAGRSACGPCAGCVLAGEDLARELGIEPPATIVVHSPYTSLPYPLRVCGLAGRPYSWMLVSDLSTARSVRGLSEGQASVVVVHSNGSAGAVLEALGAQGRGLGERVVLAVRSAGGNLTAKLYRTYAGEALDRLGVPEQILQAIVVAVCAAISASAATLGGFLLHARRREVEVLRAVGVSARAVKASLAALALAYSLLGALLSYLLLPLLPLRPRLLGFELTPQPSPLVLAAGVLLVWLSTSLGLARGWAGG